MNKKKIIHKTNLLGIPQISILIFTVICYIIAGTVRLNSFKNKLLYIGTTCVELLWLVKFLVINLLLIINPHSNYSTITLVLYNGCDPVIKFKQPCPGGHYLKLLYSN